MLDHSDTSLSTQGLMPVSPRYEYHGWPGVKNLLSCPDMTTGWLQAKHLEWSFWVCLFYVGGGAGGEGGGGGGGQGPKIAYCTLLNWTQVTMWWL